MERRRHDDWSYLYTELLHNVDELILFFDRRGRIIKWNVKAAVELGYQTDQMRSITVNDIFPSAFSIIDEKVYVNGTFDRMKLMAYRCIKTCFSVELTVIEQEEGPVQGMILAKSTEEFDGLRTEIERLKKQTKEYEISQDAFVATVTHELRTPLNGIIGMLALLSKTQLTDEQQEFVDTAINCSHNMERMINDILEYSKLKAGKLIFDYQPVDPKKLLQEIWNQYEGNMIAKNLKYHIYLSEDIPTVLYGDSMRIAQVVHNLLHNAVKFTASGSIALEATVSKVKEDKVELFIAVEDTGIGISEAGKEKLFRSFSQVDSSITREYGGNGLGLAVSKEIVNHMEGNIGVTSKEGQGSCFFFTIWLKREQGTKLNGIHDKESSRNEFNYNKDMGHYKNDHNLTIDANYLPKIEAKCSMDTAKIKESLNLCLSLEAYEKAEQIVHNIRSQIKEANPEVAKKLLRMELALRRADRQSALNVFDDVMSYETW